MVGTKEKKLNRRKLKKISSSNYKSFTECSSLLCHFFLFFVNRMNFRIYSVPLSIIVFVYLKRSQHV